MPFNIDIFAGETICRTVYIDNIIGIKCHTENWPTVFIETVLMFPDNSALAAPVTNFQDSEIHMML